MAGAGSMSISYGNSLLKSLQSIRCMKCCTISGSWTAENHDDSYSELSRKAKTRTVHTVRVLPLIREPEVVVRYNTLVRELYVALPSQHEYIITNGFHYVCARSARYIVRDQPVILKFTIVFIELFRYRLFNGEFAVWTLNSRTSGVFFEIGFLNGSFSNNQRVSAVGA